MGTYTCANFIPGSDDPGMKAFEDAYRQKYGKAPDPLTASGYNCFWVAIKAIEMAGTDDSEKVAQVMRSGNLEWDSAWGICALILMEKLCRYQLMQIQEGGKLVKVGHSTCCQSEFY